MEWEDIKKIREEKKMTQVEVSRACGVSLAGFRIWESGGGVPSPKNLIKLKKVLGVE